MSNRVEPHAESGCRTACVVLFLAPLMVTGWMLIAGVVLLACSVYQLWRGIILVVLGLWAIIVWIWDCHVDDDCPRPDAEGETGIGYAVTPLGFIITQGVALTLTVQGKETIELFSFLVYAAAAIPTVGVLVGILRSTRHKGKTGELRRTFSAGTLRFARWSLRWGVLLALLFPGLAYVGQLPGQEPDVEKVTLDTSVCSAYVFQSKRIKEDLREGIQIFVPVTKMDFPKGLPAQLTLMASLNAKLHESWRIVNAKLFNGVPVEENEIVRGASLNPDPTDPKYVEQRVMEIILPELNPNGSYTLRLLLQRRKSDADREMALSEIRTEKACTLVALLKK